MTPRRFMIQGGVERLLRWLLGGWLIYLSAGLALRGDSPLLVALGLAECVGAGLFMRHKTFRWGAVMLLLSFAFAAGFHLRAGERPVLLAGYAAAVAALTLASSWRGAAAGSGLSPDDQTFLREFEQSRIAPADFHHRDHIRAAWAVLGSYPLSEAISRYTAAIKRLAARAGKPEIYHETITWAYLLLIHERMQEQSGDLAFPAFAARNPDLLARHPSVLAAYYSQEELDSARARKIFVLPGGPAAAARS